MAFFVDMRADGLRSLAFGSISGTYANIGSPFAHPMRIMMAQNLTDSLCTFSFDGGNNDNFVLPAGGQLIIDVSSDEFQQNGFIISVNTQMAVKGAPGSGGVYISAFYARGS